MFKDLTKFQRKELPQKTVGAFPHYPRASSRLRISAKTQNFWVFLFYIADFWQTFWVIWENGSNWLNLRLKMSFFALGRLKNHKVLHLHPNSTMQKHSFSASNFINLTHFPKWLRKSAILTEKTQKFWVNSEFLSRLGSLVQKRENIVTLKSQHPLK